jgi:hypothetical protein
MLLMKQERKRPQVQRLRKSDFECFSSTRDMSNSSESVRIFWGDHPHWPGTLHLRGDGQLSRPGVDVGNFKIDEEELFWCDESKCYASADKSFSLREMLMEAPA